jgi:hypothetical protein
MHETHDVAAAAIASPALLVIGDVVRLMHAGVDVGSQRAA